MVRTLLAAVVLCLLRIPPGHAQAASDRYCADDGVRTLTVSMYPFIPDAYAIAFAIKQGFEAGCPGLNLTIKMSQSYYKSGSDGNILRAESDVYEVDSVFFADFVPRAQAPSRDLVEATGTPVAIARQAATVQGTRMGIPHWMCSNFLVFRTDRPEIASIRTLGDAARVFGDAGTSRGMLMDLRGTLTLGELYLSTLVSRHGSAEAALRRLASDTLDPDAVGAIQRTVDMEPRGFGRSRDYHGRDGFYQRQFVRNAGDAVVGYSEETYYALSESAESCRVGECVSSDKIDVIRWPFSEDGAKPVAWIDMYMIDAKAKGVTLRDAEAFIKFMLLPQTYKTILVSDSGIPRYLLPAREDLYSDPDLMAKAPLYRKFRDAIDGAVTVTAPGLNDRLQQLSPVLDAALPQKH